MEVVGRFSKCPIINITVLVQCRKLDSIIIHILKEIRNQTQKRIQILTENFESLLLVVLVVVSSLSFLAVINQV